MIDTGAELAAIALDIVKPEAINTNERINIGSFGELDEQPQTLGSAYGQLLFNVNDVIEANMHIFDRENLNGLDGILGYEVFLKYKAKIDFDNRKIIFRIKK